MSSLISILRGKSSQSARPRAPPQKLQIFTRIWHDKIAEATTLSSLSDLLETLAFLLDPSDELPLAATPSAAQGKSPTAASGRAAGSDIVTSNLKVTLRPGAVFIEDFSVATLTRHFFSLSDFNLQSAVTQKRSDPLPEGPATSVSQKLLNVLERPLTARATTPSSDRLERLEAPGSPSKGGPEVCAPKSTDAEGDALLLFADATNSSVILNGPIPLSFCTAFLAANLLDVLVLHVLNFPANLKKERSTFSRVSGRNARSGAIVGAAFSAINAGLGATDRSPRIQRNTQIQTQTQAHTQTQPQIQTHIETQGKTQTNPRHTLLPSHLDNLLSQILQHCLDSSYSNRMVCDVFAKSLLSWTPASDAVAPSQLLAELIRIGSKSWELLAVTEAIHFVNSHVSILQSELVFSSDQDDGTPPVYDSQVPQVEPRPREPPPAQAPMEPSRPYGKTSAATPAETAMETPAQPLTEGPSKPPPELPLKPPVPDQPRYGSEGMSLDYGGNADGFASPREPSSAAESAEVLTDSDPYRRLCEAIDVYENRLDLDRQMINLSWFLDRILITVHKRAARAQREKMTGLGVAWSSKINAVTSELGRDIKRSSRHSSRHSRRQSRRRSSRANSLRRKDEGRGENDGLPGSESSSESSSESESEGEVKGTSALRGVLRDPEVRDPEALHLLSLHRIRDERVARHASVTREKISCADDLRRLQVEMERLKRSIEEKRKEVASLEEREHEIAGEIGILSEEIGSRASRRGEEETKRYDELVSQERALSDLKAIHDIAMTLQREQTLERSFDISGNSVRRGHLDPRSKDTHGDANIGARGDANIGAPLKQSTISMELEGRMSSDTVSPLSSRSSLPSPGALFDSLYKRDLLTILQHRQRLVTLCVDKLERAKLVRKQSGRSQHRREREMYIQVLRNQARQVALDREEFSRIRPVLASSTHDRVHKSDESAREFDILFASMNQILQKSDSLV